MPRSNNRAGTDRARIAGALLPVALLTAGVAGCVAGPDFAAPPAPATADYTAEPLPNLANSDTAIDSAMAEPQQWWAPLNSQRLDTTIRPALAGNRSLDAARSTLAEAQAFSDASEAGRYPHGDLDASVGRQKYGAAFLGPDRL